MSSYANLMIVVLAGFTFFFFWLKLWLPALLFCLALMPTLKSSADTDVRNVPWYLMSDSILVSHSLLDVFVLLIHGAIYWLYLTVTVAQENEQVTITKQKTDPILSVITVIWQEWNRLSYQLAYTELQKICFRTTTSIQKSWVLSGYQDFLGIKKHSLWCDDWRTTKLWLCRHWG